MADLFNEEDAVPYRQASVTNETGNPSPATSRVSVGRILTRTSGFLKTVTSHSLQPYRGCSFGNALCGVGCYVQHNSWITQGRAWGSFVEARVNAADAYRAEAAAERRWARTKRADCGGFTIFLSSSTDPFLAQERELGVTRRVLEAMRDDPPDGLIVQTHTDRVLDAKDVLAEIARACALRVHVSIESDTDRLPGLPPPAASVARRFAAVEELKRSGLTTVVTVSPLLPIADPEAFFARIARAADAVVIDHFIGGDGTEDGSRTLRTRLPAAMAAVDASSVTIEYRNRIVAIAERAMPGRVGVNVDGFAGRFGAGRARAPRSSRDT